MDGKTAIIEKILSDADKKAEEIISAAKEAAEKKEAEASSWAEETLRAGRASIKAEAEELKRRKRTLAELDLKKLVLKLEQDLVDEVCARALEKLRSLGKKEYLSYLERLLDDYAEEGDEIILPAVSSIEEGDVKKLKVFSERNLSVGKTRGDFAGGVMLVGKICDKDLSFEAAIADLREETAAETVTELMK